MEYNSTSQIKFIFESHTSTNIYLVTSVLNIEPTYSHKLGDKLEYIEKAKSSIWELSLPLTDAYEGIDESLVRLLRMLSQARSQINILKSKGFNALISIIVYKAVNDSVGLDLNESIISQLHKLGISIHFNVYDQSMKAST